MSNESHVAVFAYATTLNVLGKSAKFDVIVPYVWLTANGLAFGVPRERYVTGFADPAFRFSMNFIGAPALTAAEFKDYRQNFILGASLRITAPLGQYDSDKLVNIGTNRWSLKPEIGFSKAFGRWTVELAPAVTFYTDNGDFFGGQTRAVAPLYSVQAHVSYSFHAWGWLALNAGYFVGGRTTVDDVENDDEQEGMRFGATLALPVNRYHSVKLYGITGYNAHCDHDFQAAGIAWQYRWGGGSERSRRCWRYTPPAGQKRTSVSQRMVSGRPGQHDTWHPDGAGHRDHPSWGGQFMLVKASITLFVLRASFLPAG